MDPASAWDVRLKELRASLQLACEVLGDRTAPVAERERAAAVFTALWPRFCTHVRAMPAHWDPTVPQTVRRPAAS
jgi:hypothetical protein